MDVLEDEPIFIEVGQPVLIKSHAETLDVRRDTWRSECKTFNIKIHQLMEKDELPESL